MKKIERINRFSRINFECHIGQALRQWGTSSFQRRQAGVDSVFVPAVVALPHHNAGKAKILGVSSQNRLAAAPQLMTMAEQGVQSWISWMGILGPANIPADRADKLTAALKALVENPKVREELTKGGLDPNFMNQKQLTDFVHSENIRVGNVVKNAKISIE